MHIWEERESPNTEQIESKHFFVKEENVNFIYLNTNKEKLKREEQAQICIEITLQNRQTKFKNPPSGS